MHVREQFQMGSLANGGHDNIHRKLFSAAGRDLHRHRICQDETRTHQEVVATPKHTWDTEEMERELGASRSLAHPPNSKGTMPGADIDLQKKVS